MIDFNKVVEGEKVKIVGKGAPGFAQLGDEVVVTKIERYRVYVKNKDGEEVFFSSACGAARLEKIAI